MEDYWRLRSELIVAAVLGEAGIPFQFTKVGPDLVLHTGAVTFGVEISSRTPRSLSYLGTALREALRERGRRFEFTISTDPIPPVAIRNNVIKDVIRQFVPDDGGPGVRSLHFAAAPARPEQGIPESRVTITLGGGHTTTGAPFNSPHMVALAEHVAVNVMREERKEKQAGVLPSVLIVDVTGTDLPDLRSWPDAFDRFWLPTDQYFAVGAMRCSYIQRNPEIRFCANPHADERILAEIKSMLGRSAAMAAPAWAKLPRPRRR